MAGPAQVGVGAVGGPEATADFVRLVRDALGRLHDPVALQTHPLTASLPVAYRAGADRERRGRALRRWLLDALGALQPASAAAVTPRVRDAERRARLLRLRYVDALAPVDVRRRLGLSKAQYFRQQAVAVAAVGSLLWRQRPAGGASASGDRAGDAGVSPAALPRRSPASSGASGSWPSWPPGSPPPAS